MSIFPIPIRRLQKAVTLCRDEPVARAGPLVKEMSPYVATWFHDTLGEQSLFDRVNSGKAPTWMAGSGGMPPQTGHCKSCSTLSTIVGVSELAALCGPSGQGVLQNGRDRWPQSFKVRG